MISLIWSTASAYAHALRGTSNSICCLSTANDRRPRLRYDPASELGSDKHVERRDRLDDRELALRRIAGLIGFRLRMDRERHFIQTQTIGGRVIDIVVHSRLLFLDVLPAQLTASKLPHHAESSRSAASTCPRRTESFGEAGKSSEGRHSAINQRTINILGSKHCL